MSDPHPVSPASLDQMAQTSTRTSRHRFGLLLLTAGNLLVFVAFFSPWFEVFKLNDPSFPFPKRGYSPWMVLRDGQFGSLDVATWVFSLLILGMALGSLALAASHAARGRAHAITVARILALVSLTLMIVLVPGIPLGLSFSWPYLNSTITYGGLLAATGFVGVLVALSMLSDTSARWQ